MPPRKTTAEFTAHAQAVHGDKYGYDKVDYKTTSEKVVITCPEHGDFDQTPGNHLADKGCPDCAGSKKVRLNNYTCNSDFTA